jgi:predicted ATP-grasp superfamily ATP-dependent carboligase
VRVHVYEFITGGGCIDGDLPPSLAREGDLMLRALLADLEAVPGIEVTFARDPRLPSPSSKRARIAWRRHGEPPAAAFARELADADAVWPIAPETGGELERLARAVVAHDRLLLTPRPAAIAVAASKRRTVARLLAHGVAAVPTYTPGERLPGAPRRWVIKPDDGAGAVDTLLFDDARQAAQALARRGAGYVAQPWIEGDSLSLSVVCDGPGTQLLSVNRQHLRVRDGALELAGLTVNALAARPDLAAFARRVAAAIPGLFGYFGIDLNMTAAGPVAIEVNPRLTTSYVGLAAALGINLAQRVVAGALRRDPGAVERRHDRPVKLGLCDGFA